MIAIYSSKPSAGQRTENKNWGETGKWDVTETVYFEDRIKPNVMNTAHVIIDIINAKVVKNRYVNDGGSNEEVMKHFIKKYNTKVQQAIAAWMNKCGIAPTETQLEKIEQNINQPGIIANVLSSDENNVPIEGLITKE